MSTGACRDDWETRIVISLLRMSPSAGPGILWGARHHAVHPCSACCWRRSKRGTCRGVPCCNGQLRSPRRLEQDACTQAAAVVHCLGDGRARRKCVGLRAVVATVEAAPLLRRAASQVRRPFFVAVGRRLTFRVSRSRRGDRGPSRVASGALMALSGPRCADVAEQRRQIAAGCARALFRWPGSTSITKDASGKRRVFACRSLTCLNFGSPAGPLARFCLPCATADGRAGFP